MLISRQFILQIYGTLRRQVCIKREDGTGLAPITDWKRLPVNTSREAAEFILRVHYVHDDGKTKAKQIEK